MSSYVIVAAIGIALFLTLVFSSSQRGRSGGLIVFFLVVFLAAWASQLWIRPMGPITYGIAWVPLVFVSSLIAFLLAFSTAAPASATPAETRETRSMLATVGFVFWVIIVIFLAAIVLGYYYAPRAPEMALLF